MCSFFKTLKCIYDNKKEKITFDDYVWRIGYKLKWAIPK